MYSIEKNCLLNGQNIGKDRCIDTLIVPKKILFALGHGKSFAISDFADLQDKVLTGELYALPNATNIVDIAEAEIGISQNDFGQQFLTFTKNFGAFKYKAEMGSCTVRKLQSLNQIPVTFFVLDEKTAQVELYADANGALRVRGIDGRMFTKPYGFRPNPTDIEMVNHFVQISMEDNKTNEFVNVPNALDINGLIDVVIDVTASTTESATFTVKEACGLADVVGLTAGDLVILDSNSDEVVITGLTEANGVYTATFATQSAGSFSLNLTNVVDQAPYYYTPQATATAFEIV